MDRFFWAGVLRPFFWLFVMLPFLALLRWLLNRYVRPKMTPRWRDFFFTKVGD